MKSSDALTPRDYERMIADAIDTRDEVHVACVLNNISQEGLEFTGRCYARAICTGMVNTALLFGKRGFHLNVMDEPYVQRLLEQSKGDMRGLRSFLNDYRYCRAQRTYYLPVAQSNESLAPLAALLEEGIGLTDRDKAELLALAVRTDKADLARLLCNYGVDLMLENNESIPQGLTRNASADNTTPWCSVASPHHNSATLTFILERMGQDKCRIRQEWFKLYFREEHFAAHLALLVLHSSGPLCDDTGATMKTLAQAGQSEALAYLLSWSQAQREDAQEALEYARSAKQVECAALLMDFLAKSNNKVEALSW